MVLYTGSLLYIRFLKNSRKKKKPVNKVVSNESPLNLVDQKYKITDLNVVFHDFKNNLDIAMVTSTSMHVDPSTVGKHEVTSKFVKLLYDPKQLPSNFLNFN